MDWTAKIPYQLDWETLAQFSGKEVDDGHVNSHRNSNESVYSSGGGACSNSELGNGSSRSSVSIGSPSNTGNRIPELNFDSGDQSTGDLKENKVLARMESGILHTVESSYGPKEPLIGLKLGKRTYFEDVCRGINIRSSSSLASMNSSIDLVKKPKVSQQNMQSSHCQVDGCNDDLAAVKDYHRKHRVCERHSKSPKVTVAGHDCRFCQQCSRFHGLSEFDQNKRSCRKRLYDHNARRRKPQPEAMSFGSSMLSPSCFDDGQQMSFVFSQAPLGQVTNMASSTWDDSGLFKLIPTKGSLVDLSEGGINEHMHFPSTRSNKISTVHHNLDRLLPFKGTTAEVLNKGLGAHVATSNLYGAPDLRRVLSLLSYEPWVPSNLEPISDFQFVNANTNAAHSAIHPTNSTTGIWQQDELPPTRSTPFDRQSNGSRLQLHRTL